jgi:uncharacterized membrane protein (UPF0127 family)
MKPLYENLVMMTILGVLTLYTIKRNSPLKNKMLEIIKQDGTLICRAKEADTILKGFIGLMLTKSLPKDTGLLITFPTTKPPHDIHGFFMRYTIDVVFIDKDLKVVDLATVKPWRIYITKEKAKYALELKEGTIKEKKIEIGDKLKITTIKEFRIKI